MSGIYVHIPFCSKACHYCDFHFSTKLDNISPLIEALKKESSTRKNYLKEKTVESIYFGGGTPSLLKTDQLKSILETLYQNHLISSNVEITLEANPDDLSEKKIKELISCGINRLSIGIQSLISEELIWMNRTHSAKQGIESIKLAKDSGINNITIDLIYGSKYQTLNSWQETLAKICNTGVNHLSCYQLTIESKTVLGHRFSKNIEALPDEDFISDQFKYLMKWSEESGFEQYEISNFAKNGAYSIHNSSYWLGKEYLGLGPSAHSYNGNSRQWNISNNNTYISSINNNQDFFEMEHLDEKTKMNEYILTKLRTKWGLNYDEIKINFPNYYEQLIRKINSEIKSENLILKEEKKVILTMQGKLLADFVSKNLFF
ncbi:MAG: radical SAM family heme chaperone HemW [Bacteroidota bacterium]